MAVIAGCLCESSGGVRCVVRGWSRLRGRRVDARAHEEKQIDEKNGDEDEAADPDVGPESHDGFVLGKIRGWDVFVLVVAFMVMFGHAHKLTLQMRVRAGMEGKNHSFIWVCQFRRPGLGLLYSSRPGRDMSSRMASLGLLLWWRMASICSVMGISTA